MDYRTGKCSQCGAEYKVPASFAHNAARCKKCQGVVHLGPPPAAAGASSRPAAPGSPSIPAKRVVPKPESARPPAAAPRPAAPKPAAPAPAAAKGGTLERLKSERAAHGDAPAPAKPAPARPAPVAAAASARGKEREAEGHGAKREKRGGRAERGPREKKKAPVVGIVSVAALVIVGAVVVLFRESLFGGGEAGASEGTAATPAATTPAATPGAPAATEVAAAPSDAQREPAAEAEAPAGDAPAAAPAEKPKAEPKDPASVDLTAIPDFGPTPDTTSEEWTKMNEQIVVWMDVEAGAAGNRAKLELIKQKRKAVPAILNAFKRLDFATKEGRSNGDQIQKALEQISNGRNFDWRYADEAAGRPYENPDDVYFCKRVVEEWTKLWKQAEQDIKAWIRIAKLEEKDPAEAKRLLEMFGGQSPPDAGSSDDLEVD